MQRIQVGYKNRQFLTMVTAVLACHCLLVFSAMGAEAGTMADVSSATQAFVPWGDPQVTDGGRNIYTCPPWVLAAYKDGGRWITNDNWYGWQASLGDWQTDLTTNRLLIHIDRALVTSNLWIAVAGVGEPQAALLAGFYDNDLSSVVDPVILHVSTVVPWYTNTVDLSRMPAASVISFSTTNGLMRIFSSVLYQETAAKIPASTVASPCATPTKSTQTSAVAKTGKTSTGGAMAGLAPVVAAAVVVAVPPPDTASVDHVGPRMWYVDADAGDDDLCDGTAKNNANANGNGNGNGSGNGSGSGNSNANGNGNGNKNGNNNQGAAGIIAAGPKRTLTSVLAGSAPGDTITVAAGTYSGKVRLDGVRLITNGRVVLQ